MSFCHRTRRQASVTAGAVLWLAAVAGSVVSAPAEGPARAGIRGDGTLLVNGKPVFPVGARTEAVSDLAEIADTGFNLAMGSGEWGAEHYAEADRHGLLIFAGHYVWASFRGTQEAVNLRAREDALVKSLLTAAKDQSGRTLPEALTQFDHLPGVIGWKTGDEPEAKLTELVEIGYEAIKSYNPQRVVGPIICDRQWFGNYRNAADVIIVDNYPLRGTYEKKYHTSINETYRRVKRAVDTMAGKAVWFMPPLYPYSYWSLVPEEEFTLRDLRLVNYAGLIAGAKGIVMFHWGLMDGAWGAGEEGGKLRIAIDEATAKQRLGIVRSLVRELHALGPVICDGRPNDEPDIRWTGPGVNGPGPQLTRVIEYEGRQYLLVMNLLDVPLEGMVFGPDPAHNWRAYDAEVFLGREDLAVTAERPGQPVITVAPRGSGVFVLNRRSIIPAQSPTP